LTQWGDAGEEEIAVFRDPALIEAALERMEYEALTWEGRRSLHLSVASDGENASYDGAADMDPHAVAREYTFYLNPGNPALDMLLEAAGKR
ncbi:MAG: hypothetical protein LBD95_05795, partial [Clostridiales Family XIII bacterium]|nr:hypothetical protein [Clostridiales Family XIII bacterium]